MTAEIVDTELLDEETVVAYLEKRGLIGQLPGALARPLGGGVSNVVLAVENGATRLVVKQSLARLRVAEEWLAPRERALTEADGLQLAHRLTPGAVPRVRDRDAERCVITIDQAPAGWSDWKSRLLDHEPDATDHRVARRLGELLTSWQDAPAADLGPRLADPAAFDALRIDPYYRAVAARRPEHATTMQRYAEQLVGRRQALSHGDFSPKNVLVGPGGVWVIDFEVAHLGDPAFDVAFLLSHLLLKSLHRPQWTGGYRALAEAFTGAYRPAQTPDWAYVAGHVGCLLLARIDGKSPAEYLTAPQRGRANRLAAALLTDPPARPQQMWAIRTRLEEFA